MQLLWDRTIVIAAEREIAYILADSTVEKEFAAELVGSIKATAVLVMTGYYTYDEMIKVIAKKESTDGECHNSRNYATA